MTRIFNKSTPKAIMIFAILLLLASVVFASLVSCMPTSNAESNENKGDDETYEIRFVTSEEKPLGAKICNKGESVIPPKAPVKEEFIFTGWDGNFTDIEKSATLVATYMDVSGMKNAICADTVVTSSTSEFIVKIGVKGEVNFSSIDINASYESDLLELVEAMPANTHSAANKIADGVVNVLYNAPKNTTGYTNLVNLVFRPKCIDPCETEVKFNVNSMHVNEQGLLKENSDYNTVNSDVVIISSEGERFELLPDTYVYSNVSGVKNGNYRNDEFTFDIKAYASDDGGKNIAIDENYTVKYLYSAKNKDGNVIDQSKIIEILSIEEHKYRIRSDAEFESTATVVAEVVNNTTNTVEFTKIVTVTVSPKTYKITFEPNGGNVYNAKGDYITELVVKEHEAPSFTESKVGNTFIGWFEDASFSRPFDNTKTLTADKTLYARWSVNKYTLSYDTGSSIKSVTLDYGAPINLSIPVKNGHTFVSWDQPIPETMPASDIAVTAKWINFTYDVSLTTKSGKPIACEVALGGEIDLLGEKSLPQINSVSLGSAKKYYNALGWFTEEGIKIAEVDGKLLAGIEGYTDSEGRWILDESKTTVLHFEPEQVYPDYTYIYDAQDLYTIASDPYGRYMLISDINMGSGAWTPIPNFYGEINGSGHCIYNFTVSKSGTGTDSVAFIKQLEQSGKITGLTIGKLNFSMLNSEYSVKYSVSYKEASSESKLDVAGFVGKNYGELSDCHLVDACVWATFSDDDNNQHLYLRTGGIVSYNFGNIRACTVKSSLIKGVGTAAKNSGDNNYVWVGGICAVNKQVVSECFVENSTLDLCAEGDGKLFNDAFPWGALGGIVGEQLEDDATIENCSIHDCDLIIYGSKGDYTSPTKHKNEICGLKTKGTIY